MLHQVRHMQFLSTLSLRRATTRRTYQTDAERAFLSTLSLRRATLISMLNSPHGQISIHALLAESDDPDKDSLTDDVYFYPRSPCGERPIFPPVDTSSVKISIHALLAESDSTSERLFIPSHYFYPRSPCGERHNKPTQHAG